MRSSFERRRTRRPDYADVQIEFTGMVFEGLIPTVVLGGVGVAGATGVLAFFYRDRFEGLLTLTMVATVLLRLGLVIAFLRHKGGKMKIGEADAWEVRYGLATCLYASLLAVSSIYNFKFHDPVAQLWCIIGSILLSSGIGARLALWPWIGFVSNMVIFLPLLYCVLTSPVLLVKLTSILLLLALAVNLEAMKTKSEVVVDQIRTKRQLACLAEQDALTGLANRRQFEIVMARASQQATVFAILYIDLDKFKAVNDTFGHGVGDHLLRAVADRLRGMVRVSDLIARLGGDEFAVLQAAPATRELAQVLATRINQEMAHPFELEGLTLQIGASVGVRLKTAEDSNPSALLSSADSALYEVKKLGRGGFLIAEPAVGGE